MSENKEMEIYKVIGGIVDSLQKEENPEMQVKVFNMLHNELEKSIMNGFDYIAIDLAATILHENFKYPEGKITTKKAEEIKYQIDDAVERSKAMVKEPVNNKMNKSYQERLRIRTIVSEIDDYQKLRISAGNRVWQSFAQRLGQEPGQSQEELDKESKALLSMLLKEYNRITDAMIDYRGTFEKWKDRNDKLKISKKEEDKARYVELKYIKDQYEFNLIESYQTLVDLEEKNLKVLEIELNKIPIYTEYLAGVKGVGPKMAGVLIGYLDPYKAKYVSSFWQYCGLGTAIKIDDDGNEIRVASTKSATEMQPYLDAEGKVQFKNGITYNQYVHTKLLGVLADVFIKCGSSVTESYYDYKNRKRNDPKYAEYTDMRINRMAKRYMIKNFIRDLWVHWRQLENLPITEPYEVAKLNRAPHKYNEYHSTLAAICKKEADEVGMTIHEKYIRDHLK